MSNRVLATFVAALVALSAGLAAQEAPGPDHGVLFVDVLPAGDLRLGEARLPFRYRGRSPKDCAELRKWLRADADPFRHPAIRQPDGTAMPRLPDVEGAPPYPSDRILRIRCSREREFGWVQMVMQLCSIVPGRAHEDELRVSPLIWRIELGILGTERWLPAGLPRDRPLAVGSPAKEAEIRLSRITVRGNAPSAALDWVLTARGRDEPFGRLRSPRGREDAAVGARLRWEPSDSLDLMGRWLSELKQRHPDAQVKLKADARSCFAANFAILESFRSAGYAQVAFAGITEDEVAALVEGRHR